MREIKFRAWNSLREQMIRNPIVNDIATDKYIGLNEVIDRLQKEDFVVMQYTGLKDKNGKEIYESDVVAYEFNNQNYRVEFLNGSFLLRRKYENIENLDPTEFNYGLEIEIIGNIYENPELLEN